ncbi:hypothetical protein CJU89_1478 [Yarrowia sp. B02]|nr:hypothetical protein CJU89_1478 [Yarrowia sp. B02]
MATPRTTKRYGRPSSAQRRQPEQMTLMSSFLNAREGSSPGAQRTPPARERDKSVFKSAPAKIDFAADEDSASSGSKSPSVGRVTKPAARDPKTRPTLRRSRGASIFDMSPEAPSPEVSSLEVSSLEAGPSAKTGNASKNIEEAEPVPDVKDEKPVKKAPKKATLPKKTATPKTKTPAKRQTVTPKVRLTRSRSRSASPAVTNDSKEETLTSTSSNGMSPHSSQTPFSSQVADKAIDIDMEDTQNDMDIDTQADNQAEKEIDDRIVFGPKKLFGSSESSGISGTSIFASAPKRKIKHLRTSTPSKKKTQKKKVVDIDGSQSTPSSSFGSSFESSQSSQEPVRAPLSVTTNRRTYGANRSYLADSPTKKENIYDSIMSESSAESEQEELNIKSVHELRETGGNARFMDEMEYLAEGLEDEGSSRRTTLLEICKKAKDPDFIRKLKTTDYADKILNVLPQVVETDQVAAFLVLFIAQKIFGDNGANVLDTVINDPKFLGSVFLCLDNTDSILRDKKSSKVFQKVLKEFVDGTTSASDDEPTPSPALAAIATLSTLQTYPGASGSTILKACLQPENWEKFRTFAIDAFEENEYKVLQLVVFFLDFCQHDVFFSSLAAILDELAKQLESGKPNNSLVDLSLPVLRLLIVFTNESSIPELDGSFVLKCISLAETLHSKSKDPKLYEVYLLCLGFLENIIGVLTTDYQKVYGIFTRLARGKEDKHCQAFLTLLRKNVATRGGLKLSAEEQKELE